MPVPIGFLRQPSAGRSMRAARAIRAFGNAYTATTELLNFASVLTRPFRIVWTVTILQQAVPCFYGGRMARGRPGNTSYNEAIGNHASLSSAEALSKMWRYFPTY